MPSLFSFVLCRKKTILFEAPISYESPSFVPAGDIFLAASRAHIVDDFAMIFVGFRAIKVQSLRFASSGDLVYLIALQKFISPAALAVFLRVLLCVRICSLVFEPVRD